jgi:hypothetical protein
LKKIELPSEALAKELQKFLQDRRFVVEDRASASILFPDEMKPSDWSNLKSVVDKWGRGRQLEVVESLRLQPVKRPKPETEDKEKEADTHAELVKKIDSMGPDKAEERYNYLQNKPIRELTDAEYDERLELAQRNFKKWRINNQR